MSVRLFKDKEKYDELMQMLERRETYKSIARHFHCDHTSIVYWARKCGIPPKNQIVVIRTRIYIDTQHPILQKEKLNPGKKSYADYLAESKARSSTNRASVFA